MSKYNSLIFSGFPGSGKSTLAKELADVYKCEVYSMGKLWREEHKRLYPNQEISFEEYWKNTTTEDNLNADKKAREIFEQGHVIGDLRYSILCRGLPTLRVFVTADLETRAKRAFDAGNYGGKSFDEIIKILMWREKDELKKGKELYGEGYDFRDPNNYHLILNSGVLTIDQEKDIVHKALFGKVRF